MNMFSTSVKQILFVCTGNVCRSVIAEKILKKILSEKGITDIVICSAGIEANPEYKVYGYLEKVMHEADIDFSDHISTQITENQINNSDLIFVMEKRHKQFILDRYPGTEKKVFLLKNYAGYGEIDITDPIGQPPPAHRQKLEEITDCIYKILPKILKCFT